MVLWGALGFVVCWCVNVIADCGPYAEPLAAPRCLNCGTPRARAQWLGVVAYLSGQTRCRQCHERITWRWPLVELVGIVLCAYLFFLFGLSLQLLLSTLYSALLLLLCVIDLEHCLILNRIIYPAIALSFALSFVTPNLSPLSAIVGGLIGFAVTGLIYLGGKLFVRVQARRGRALDEVAFGQGDVRLMLFIGLITGATGVGRALLLGVVLGGVAALGIIVFGLLRRESKLYVPYAYGPYLALGGWVVLIQNSVASSP
ncbi:MAG: prepilin peptidase [Chloroflexota bacterium]